MRADRERPAAARLDMDGDTIPQEAGINERAVSFTKGCYVGQETVARLHYKGKPNRHLRGLRLGAPAARGDEILLGEQVVGRLGSACESPRLGPIALALVRREAAPGRRGPGGGDTGHGGRAALRQVTERATGAAPRGAGTGLSGSSPLLGGPLTAEAGAEEPRLARAALRRPRAATLDLPRECEPPPPQEPRELRELIPPPETGRQVDDWGRSERVVRR